MIVIFTTSQDYTTKIVLEWLRYLGKNFLRINDGEPISISSISYDQDGIKAELIHGDLLFNSREIKSVWFRKEAARINDYFIFNNEMISEKTIRSSFLKSISAMSVSRQEILNHLFHDLPKIKLGNNFQGRQNKILALNTAVKVGLDIPKTLITTSKKELWGFYLENNCQIITKSLDINFFGNEKINDVVYNFMQYTAIINEDEIVAFPDYFALTTFQEKLEKYYELRVFYLCGEIWSQAYFTQTNQKTAIDSRNYDQEKRTPTVPYELDKSIKDRIRELMTSLDLNTGSLDFVKTQDGRLVFLEVNPQGQFGYVSHSNNFYLEKEIAGCL